MSMITWSTKPNTSFWDQRSVMISLRYSDQLLIPANQLKRSLANQTWIWHQNLKLFHNNIWLEDKCNCLISLFFLNLTSESTHFIATCSSCYSRHKRLSHFFPKVFYSQNLNLFREFILLKLKVLSHSPTQHEKWLTVHLIWIPTSSHQDYSS